MEVARNLIALTDQINEESGNNISTLPMPFDINTCQTNFQLVKVAAYEENGLQILHGCIATMMQHVIVQVVSGLLKAIDFQENIKKEFKTINGLK